MPVLPGTDHRPRISTKEGAMKYEGTWRITEMETWGDEYLHLEVQAYIRIRRDGSGEFQFGLLSGQLDGEVRETASGERFEFTWDGTDEGEEASGSGWLAMVSKNTLAGKIKLHHGDSSTLVAERASQGKTRD